MINREEVTELLDLHQRAYQLLLWLGQQAVRHPDTLSPETVRALTKPATCADWLASNQSKLPARMLPSGGVPEEFVNLVASFFSTSFHVEHLSFGKELLDSTLRTGSVRSKLNALTYTDVQALALRHLGGSEGIRITDGEARILAKRKSLQPELLLWTYIWELDRRAKGKGKGEVAHRIWRNLPIDLRKNITTQKVWEARDKIMDTIRSFIAERQ